MSIMHKKTIKIRKGVLIKKRWENNIDLDQNHHHLIKKKNISIHKNLKNRTEINQDQNRSRNSIIN